MRKALRSAERGFTVHDRHRLARALRRTAAARVFRRIQAVLLIAEGRRMGEAAQITGLTLQSVDNLVQRYWHTHQSQSLDDRPPTGRPPDASGLTAVQIVRELRRSPAWVPHEWLDGANLGLAAE